MSWAERLSFDSRLFISIVGSKFQHWQRGLSQGDGLMTCCQAPVPCLMLVAPADTDTVWSHVAFPAGTVGGGCRGSRSPFPDVSCKHNSIQLVLGVRAGASKVSLSLVVFFPRPQTALLPPPLCSKTSPDFCTYLILWNSQFSAEAKFQKVRSIVSL